MKKASNKNSSVNALGRPFQVRLFKTDEQIAREVAEADGAEVAQVIRRAVRAGLERVRRAVAQSKAA